MKKFLITIVVVLIVALGSAAIWLATLDGSYDVKRSITINKPNAEVFNLVQDFNQWKTWSPWLCMEPEAEVNISGNGKKVGDTYAWTGELVGSGEMKHVKIVDGKSIDQDIVFKEPMESSSFVYWEFSNINDSTTEVTWGMKGEMPFIVRFMAEMMEPMIGMDYERGLKMMKELAEKGYVASKVEIIGIVDAEEIKYMGERTACNMDEVGDNMKNSFNKLHEYAATNNIQYNKALTVYHDFDLIKGNCDYTTAIPVKDTTGIAKPYYGDISPAIKALKIRFTGDYEHIGNAWAAGMTYSRTYKLNESKKIPPYELYLTNPMEETDSRKWVTEVYLPINE
ncbi:SRPBCC family protein [Labilibacter marinus]|uniref:SRPBCC family protein n=1 Tax=Labilibacter marinus TaxID=1477105 RepID=UPI00094F861D|nr:SRPBCC family protein [Labilibacter marinus]